MNRPLLRTAVLVPLAAFAVLAAAPARARTDGGGRTAAPTVSAVSAAPEEGGLDLDGSRVVRRCDATARSALRDATPRSTLRDATTIAAGGTEAAAAAGCAAAVTDPIRPLTGPAPGALFEAVPAPRGVIPERSLS